MQRVFVLDGVGALVSALCLGFVLPALSELVGMPVAVLRALAGLALVFALNAALAYRFAGRRAALWLGVVAAGNLAYCVLTGCLVALHFEGLTALGVAYFVGEIVVILGLVLYECRALRAALTPPPS